MVDVPLYYTDVIWLMIAGVAAAVAAGISAWQAKQSKQAIALASQQVDESKKLTELQLSVHIYERYSKLYEDSALSSGTFVDDMKSFLSSHPDVTIKDLPIGAHDYKFAVRKLKFL